MSTLLRAGKELTAEFHTYLITSGALHAIHGLLAAVASQIPYPPCPFVFIRNHLTAQQEPELQRVRADIARLSADVNTDALTLELANLDA